jgi:hypothetical protein
MSFCFRIKFDGYGVLYGIGPEALLETFFETIICKLENNNPGSRFPYIINHLYKDKKLPLLEYSYEVEENMLLADEVKYAICEAEIIKEEFKKLKAEEVVYLYESDRNLLEGTYIKTESDSLYDSFITTRNNNLVEQMLTCLNEALSNNLDIRLAWLTENKQKPINDLIVGERGYVLNSAAGTMISFFSTIQYRLENNIRGSRFPNIMNGLNIEKKIKQENIKEAIKELKTIQAELKNFPISAVIFRLKDIHKLPPWHSCTNHKVVDL